MKQIMHHRNHLSRTGDRVCQPAIYLAKFAAAKRNRASRIVFATMIWDNSARSIRGTVGNSNVGACLMMLQFEIRLTMGGDYILHYAHGAGYAA